MNFLNLTSDDPFTLDEVASAIKKFCARPWHEVSNAVSLQWDRVPKSQVLLMLLSRMHSWGVISKSGMGRTPSAPAVNIQVQAGAAGTWV